MSGRESLFYSLLSKWKHTNKCTWYKLACPGTCADLHEVTSKLVFMNLPQFRSRLCSTHELLHVFFMLSITLLPTSLTMGLTGRVHPWNACKTCTHFCVTIIWGNIAQCGANVTSCALFWRTCGYFYSQGIPLVIPFINHFHNCKTLET